jgi:putative ABC transport system permease protein
MFDLWSDLRHACRRFAAQPGYTTVMIATLALAIGATTAVFTVVDEVLLRRAPFAFADRLVDVLDVDRATGNSGSNLTPEKIVGWQSSPIFERFEGYSPRQFEIAGDGEPERTSGLVVTTGLFPMLGIQPMLGRGFAAGEGRPESARVVIIAEGLWKRRFGGAADVLGRTLTLNDERHTVIGVMPRRFRLIGSTTTTDVLWVPVDPDAPGRDATPRFWGVARLAPRLTIDGVQATANALADQYQTAHPLAGTWGLSIRPKGVASVAAGTRTVLLTLLGAVACVLLIACANVANLILSGAAARERETAIRSALGASRARLVRAVLVESVLLALIGGALGILVAGWGVSAALAMAPIDLAARATTTIEIDGRILTTALLVTIAAGMLVGIIPALRGSRPTIEQTLRAAGHTSGHRASALSSALVVAEVSLALVLLVGAALLMRTFANLHAIDAGFEMHGLISAQIRLSPARYASDAARALFVDDIRQRLARLPGVTDVTVASSVPPPGVGGFSMGVEGEGGIPDPKALVAQNTVAPDFFHALRIPLKSGRPFSPHDADTAVIVSQSVADRFWPGGSAVGRRIRLASTQPWRTIVGVVGSVEMWMGDTRLSRAIYAPFNPATARAFTVTMRTSEITATAASVKRQVWQVDPNLPLDSPTIIDAQWDNVFGRQRFALQLMSAFALAALTLAAAGIFAVLSQLVSQRTREIGVRVALGATPRHVFQLVVGRGLALTAAGVAIGLAGAIAVTRLLKSLLFETSPYDPASFAVVTGLLVGVAFVACWLPTRRAMRVDPAVALRVE